MTRTLKRTLILIVLMAVTASPALAQHGPTRARLVITDTESVAWMTINNSFNDFSVDPVPWLGVLIQIGDYDARPVIDTVQFMNNGKLVGEPFRRDATGRFPFTWINIVARDTGKAPPMSHDKVGFLLPDVDPDLPTVCDDFDACAKQQCLVDEIEEGCLRSRSLHANFYPVAVITYWQGDRGYEVLVGPGVKTTEIHQIFEFRDPVDIFIFGFGDPEPMKLDASIDTILLFDDPGTEHGKHFDPPFPDGG